MNLHNQIKGPQPTNEDRKKAYRDKMADFRKKTPVEQAGVVNVVTATGVNQVVAAGGRE